MHTKLIQVVLTFWGGIIQSLVSLSGRESDYDKAIIKAYPKEKDQEETTDDSLSLL
jgi:hypothetical protein